MHGYIPFGQSEKVTFKKDQSFDKRYRQFEILKVETVKKTKVVIGSKGTKYYISESGCSCPGFTYRGKCKHMETT
jgi:predicted nucleic acid-binding Zn finger protein